MKVERPGRVSGLEVATPGSTAQPVVAEWFSAVWSGGRSSRRSEGVWSRGQWLGAVRQERVDRSGVVIPGRPESGGDFAFFVERQASVDDEQDREHDQGGNGGPLQQ